MQQWGQPFTNYEEAFGIYQPFIANQRKAAAIAMREFDKIRLAEHPVVVDFNTLDGFLLKPMQRLVKYPLLLKVLANTRFVQTWLMLIARRTYAIRPTQMNRQRMI